MFEFERGVFNAVDPRLTRGDVERADAMDGVAGDDEELWGIAGASLTTTLATVRSTEVLGPILVDLRWKMRTPGVVATSQRFCQRRKLSTQTLT